MRRRLGGRGGVLGTLRGVRLWVEALDGLWGIRRCVGIGEVVRGMGEWIGEWCLWERLGASEFRTHLRIGLVYCSLCLCNIPGMVELIASSFKRVHMDIITPRCARNSPRPERPRQRLRALRPSSYTPQQLRAMPAPPFPPPLHPPPRPAERVPRKTS